MTVDEFLQRLRDSGLVSEDNLQAACEASAADNVKALASELVRRGRLTKYQANAVWQGKHGALVMGNYVILDVLGAGGMGTVFKAEHRRLKRTVAVKMLSPAAMKLADAVDRFHRETQAVGKLKHRNIVAAHDAGEFEGNHFLVMEYVEGPDLDRLVVQRGPLPPEIAAACILQAARGLEYAHAHGVLHRDVKPANLLIAVEDDQPVVKLLDLGLAWVHDSTSDSTQHDPTGRLTQGSRIMGTVTYMAPEQALEIRSADQRADVYSLGCTFYFLVAGRVIYEGDSVLRRLIAHREAPIPSLPGANELLNALLKKLVAKLPAERYQSMTEVIAALEQCGITDAQAGAALNLPGAVAASPAAGSSQLSVSLAGISQLALAVDSKPSKAASSVDVVSKLGRSLSLQQLVAAAAIIVVLLGLAAWWRMDRGSRQSTTSTAMNVSDAKPSVPVSNRGALEAESPIETTVVAEQPTVAVVPTPAPDTSVPRDPTGEYAATISGESWGLQVRPRAATTFAVRLMKGGVPGDGWDRQTVYDLTASLSDGRVALDKNPRINGAFRGEELIATDALGDQFTAQRIHRRSATLGQPPPTNAVVLFDGRDTAQWTAGEITPDGWLKSGATTKSSFRDFNLHLEYRLPTASAASEQPQGRLLLPGRYAVAVADSFGADASPSSAAAILGVAAPLLNTSCPPTDWQTLDIAFTAPHSGGQTGRSESARCTVRHNGVVVHDRRELPAPNTGAGAFDRVPIVLGAAADTGIVFRNLWIEDLRPAAPVAATKPNWPEPNAGAKRRVRAAAGMIRDDFALVQTMPLDEFAKSAEWLFEAGYRPVRLRPFPTTATGPIQTAALWQRDGCEWKLATGTAGEIQKQAEQFQAEGLWPVDVAGYLGHNNEAFAMLWARLPEKPAAEARLALGVRQVALSSTINDLQIQGFSQRIAQGYAQPLAIVHNQLWWKSAARTEYWYGDLAYFERQNAGFLIDLCVTRGPLKGASAYSWCTLLDPPAGWESIELHGLHPDAHLKRCGELAEQGYRPVAIGTAQVNAPIAVQSCSVWHRKKE